MTLLTEPVLVAEGVNVGVKVSVCEGAAGAVGVLELVGVCEGVAVAVGVSVGRPGLVGVCVAVGMAVVVLVGKLALVAVGVGVLLDTGMLVGVFVAVEVWVGVCVDVGVAVSIWVAVGVEVKVAVPVNTLWVSTTNCGGVVPSREENVIPSVLSATSANVYVPLPVTRDVTLYSTHELVPMAPLLSTTPLSKAG